MPTAAVIGTSILSSALQSRSQRHAADRAAGAETESQQRALDATREAAERARADAIPLFSSGQSNVLRGYEAANELAGQSIPEQIRAFQSGNMGAQNALLQGLPQMQNAILGGPINNNALQMQRVNAPPPSFFQRDLPEFETIEQALAPPAPTPQVNLPNFGGFGGLGGLGGFGLGGFGGMGGTGGFNPNNSMNTNPNNPNRFMGNANIGVGGLLGLNKGFN